MKDSFDKDFLKYLVNRLKCDLPGLNAHKKMAPLVGEKFFRRFKPDSKAKNSAVLVLFTDYSIETNLLFTLRSTNISHSGQISFPGGRMEENETAEYTALRETFEETGISSDDIMILGACTKLYVPPSNSIISPVIGVIKKEPVLKINPKEVQEVFLVPFNKFLTEKYKKIETKDFDGFKVDVPFWDIHHTTPLWGATAMILMEIVELYYEYKSNNNI